MDEKIKINFWNYTKLFWKNIKYYKCSEKQWVFFNKMKKIDVFIFFTKWIQDFWKICMIFYLKFILSLKFYEKHLEIKRKSAEVLKTNI